jgi:hypothetical protein
MPPMSDPQAAAAPLVLSPSERVLLCADRFSTAAGMLGYGEVSLSTGVKLDADAVARRMVAAAFLANEQAGALRLELRQEKALFGLMKTEALHAVPGGRSVSWPAGSLEGQVAGRVAAGPKVQDLVRGILGSESASPAQTLCARAKAALATRGVLHAEEKKTLKLFTSITYSLPPAVLAAAQQTGVAAQEQLLAACEQQRPAVWKALLEAIRGAFVAMTESRD